MQIVWTARFNKSLEYTFTCARDFYSKNILSNLHNEIKHQESLLKENPQMGTIESLLEGRSFEYRYLVIKPYHKIIYCVNNDIIYMIDLWDTRRDPKISVKGLS